MKLERYLPPSFDESLDSPRIKEAFAPPPWAVKKEVEPEPPPPPTFSEAELEAARQEGYRRGFLEGEAEGKTLAQSELAQLDRQIEALLAPIAAALHAQMIDYNAFVKEARGLAPQVALAVAKKIAGDALAQDALPLLDEMASEVVARMLGEPRIVVTVNAALAERFEAKMAERFANSQEPGDLVIHGDASLPVTDCRIEWANGQARISHAQRLQHIEDYIAGVSASEQFNHTDFIPNQGEQP